MTSARNIKINEAYGAQEIKRFIKKATFEGFAITLLFLGLASGLTLLQKESKPTTIYIESGFSTVNTIGIKETNTNVEILVPNEIAKISGSIGTGLAAGNYIPVDEELIKNAVEIAGVALVGLSSSKGNEAIRDNNVFSTSIATSTERVTTIVDAKIETEEPDINFIPEIEPQVNYSELTKSIVYPDIARKAGIEGRVIVSVLISKEGKPIKTKIESETNEMLNKAAVKAVMSAIFTPARQENIPVNCWISIPIDFKLK